MTGLAIAHGVVASQAVEAEEEIPALAFVATKATQDRAADTSHTWSVAMANASGASRMLIMAVGSEAVDPGPTLDAATYNGVAGTLEATISDSEGGTANHLKVWSWKGEDLPNDTANHDMVVTPSASEAIAAGIVEYIGVEDALAEDVDTSNVDPVDAMSVESTAGALVFHAVNSAVFNLDVTADNSQNIRVDLDASTASLQLVIVDLVGVSAGTVTSGITFSGGQTRAAQAALSFAKAAS